MQNEGNTATGTTLSLSLLCLFPTSTQFPVVTSFLPAAFVILEHFLGFPLAECGSLITLSIAFSTLLSKHKNLHAKPLFSLYFQRPDLPSPE